MATPSPPPPWTEGPRYPPGPLAPPLAPPPAPWSCWWCWPGLQSDVPLQHVYFAASVAITASLVLTVCVVVLLGVLCFRGSRPTYIAPEPETPPPPVPEWAHVDKRSEPPTPKADPEDRLMQELLRNRAELDELQRKLEAKLAERDASRAAGAHREAQISLLERMHAQDEQPSLLQVLQAQGPASAPPQPSGA